MALDYDPTLRKYMGEISDSKPLSGEEEADLARRIRQGDLRARNELVYANLRFVFRVAVGYQNRGLTLAELISAGNVGLFSAAERFDETRGYKFISYAVTWVRQSILSALANESRAVRVPLNRLGDRSRAYQVAEAHEKNLDNWPDLVEVGKKLDMHGERISDLEYSLQISKSAMSLDATLDDDEGSNLYNLLPDESSPPPDKQALDERLADEIREVLSTLPEREADIIRMYFGFDDGVPKTLDDIGKIYRLSRERIRQIKETALFKLQHPRRAGRLRPYIESNR